MEFEPGGFKPDLGERLSVDVELRLALADKDKRLYGWPDEGAIIEARWDRKGYKKPVVDLVFCVDVTSSMSDDVERVAREVGGLLENLRRETDDLRVRLVTFADEEKEGEPYKPIVSVPFEWTKDSAAVADAVKKLTVSGGDNVPEAVYSGLMAALDGAWRDKVTKIVLLLGDAPPNSKDLYTLEDVDRRSCEVDPADIYAIALPGGSRHAETVSAFSEITKRCRGETFTLENAADLPAKMLEVLKAAVAKPPSPATTTRPSGGGGGGGSGLTIVPTPPPVPEVARRSSARVAAVIVMGLCIVALAALLVVLLGRRGGVQPPGIGLVAQTPAGLHPLPVRGDRMTFGRSREASVRFADPRVSGVHATLTRTGTGYTLTDHGSQNGTFVNGQRITQRTPVKPGDVIRIGDTEIRVTAPG